MFRVILYLLLAVVLISVLRSVIGIVMKGLGALLSTANQSSPSASPDPPKSQLGGDLHRDPICGTFVAESTPHHRRTSGGDFYYCSDSCKEKHALVVR
jgi:hypothetical protein